MTVKTAILKVSWVCVLISTDMKLQLQCRHTLKGHRNTKLPKASGADAPQPRLLESTEKCLRSQVSTFSSELHLYWQRLIRLDGDKLWVQPTLLSSYYE